MFEPIPIVEETLHNHIDENVKRMRLDCQMRVNSMFAHSYWHLYSSEKIQMQAVELQELDD